MLTPPQSKQARGWWDDDAPVPEAGPSRWRWPTTSWRRETPRDEVRAAKRVRRNDRGEGASGAEAPALAPVQKRQTGASSEAPSASSSATASGGSIAAAPVASASGPSGSLSSPPLFPTTTTGAPSTSASSSSSSNNTDTRSSLSANPSASSSSSSSYSWSPTPTDQWAPSSSTRSFTSIWSNTRTYSRPTPSFVPGVTFNLTLAGERADEAVYAVEVDLGHGGMTRRAHRGSGGGGDRDKRQSGVMGSQRMRLQVDLGSSDMWVATSDCTSAECRTAPSLFDSEQSIQSGVDANITYHSGSVAGTIMWESVSMSTFGIAYQAFIAATSINNQNLDGANYAGVLGLALPANSIISSLIPGTTTSNPDGATFLDNLFGSGTLAPSQRIFSLALERREDVRTVSRFTIGSVFGRYCPDPCQPSWIPIIPHPNLGPIGYLHWRIPLSGARATTWSDQSKGTGAQMTTVRLGASVAVPSRPQPLAVLDSGGVAVLVGHQAYADAFYQPYGVSMSSDGMYRLPCKTQLAWSFQFGSTWYAAHPLDMSWPDPSDPSQGTCIGAIQYAPQLGDRGDFVLGSSFLKNVYSIFSYPDPSLRGTWTPGVGLYTLTNASVASQDFYSVRYLRNPLSAVSSSSPPGIGVSSPNNPAAEVTPTAGGESVMNTTAIVAGSVVGFFVLAAAAFCGWWFWLRRKHGRGGRVEYKSPPERKVSLGPAGAAGLAADESERSRKHSSALRQKSMVEGYSDYSFEDEGSWTEGADSVRMAYLPEVPEVESPVDEHEVGHAGVGIGGEGDVAERLVDVPEVAEAGNAGSARSGAVPPPIVPIPFARRPSAGSGTGTGTGPDDVFGPNAPDAPLTPGSGRPLLSAPSPASSPVALLADARTRSPIRFGQPLPMPASGMAGAGAGGGNSARRHRSRDAAFPRSGSSRSTSMSMSGPFPSPLPPPGHRDVSGSGSGGGGGGGHDIGSSPMHDIRAGDYFDVPVAVSSGAGAGVGSAAAAAAVAARGRSGLPARRGSAGVLERMSERPEGV